MFYGRGFFEYLDSSSLWDELLSWLNQWKLDLPDFPEINLDLSPEQSFEEIKALETRYWRKLFSNDIIWRDGIIQVLFNEGTTLRLVHEYFGQQHAPVYQSLYKALQEKLNKCYG